MGRLLRNAVPDFDAQGHPVLRIQWGGTVSVGVSGSNIFANDASMQFTQQLLEARLHAELRRGSPPRASESDITRDWNLLQKAMNGFWRRSRRTEPQTPAAWFPGALRAGRESALNISGRWSVAGIPRLAN